MCGSAPEFLAQLLRPVLQVGDVNDCTGGVVMFRVPILAMYLAAITPVLASQVTQHIHDVLLGAGEHGVDPQLLFHETLRNVGALDREDISAIALAIKTGEYYKADRSLDFPDAADAHVDFGGGDE